MLLPMHNMLVPQPVELLPRVLVGNKQAMQQLLSREGIGPVHTDADHLSIANKQPKIPQCLIGAATMIDQSQQLARTLQA